MKRQRFTQEQIIGVLREQEAGAKTADICRNVFRMMAPGGESNHQQADFHTPEWGLHTSAGLSNGPYS